MREAHATATSRHSTWRCRDLHAHDRSDSKHRVQPHPVSVSSPGHSNPVTSNTQQNY